MCLFETEYKLTISFEDLDPLNIVWHGNYVRYMEQARCDMLAKMNYTYTDMKNEGYAYPIAKMEMKYIKPAEFGDKLIVKTKIITIEPALNIQYEIYNSKNNDKIFEAKTMQIGMDMNTKESLYTPPTGLLKAIKEINNVEI